MLFGGFIIIGAIFGAAMLGSVLGMFGVVVGAGVGGWLGYKIGKFIFTH